MIRLHKFALCMMALSLVIFGCAEDDTDTPPVLNVMNDLDDLSHQAEQAELDRTRAKLAAKTSADVDSGGANIPPDVPLEGKYVATFETSEGPFVVSVDRSWAPIGADRFYKLIKDGFFDEARFFRVVPGFMVQWGLAADPAKTAKWDASIIDDPVIQSNTRGYITFAKTGAPNSRSGQVFINYGDNSNLDGQGFAPFGKVVSGMDVVGRINSEYGESPNQGRITSQGNAYLKAEFPRLSFTRTARITVDDLAEPEVQEATTEAAAAEPEEADKTPAAAETSTEADAADTSKEE